MITVALAWFSTRICTRESSAESVAPELRFKNIGAATSVFALIVRTATSFAFSRMRPTIASSLSVSGAASSREILSKLTPAAAAPLIESEVRSAITAVPS